eukprot:PITA_24000
MVSAISPHAGTHCESLLDIPEEPPHSSSALESLSLFPPSIKFIFWNEFWDRFSFHGLKAILPLFLSEHLSLSQVRATEMFHLFTMSCYATPMLGAVISDTLLGKYRTILYLSLLYAMGNCVMSMAAIPGPDPEAHKALNYSMWSTAMGLLFIAVGTGGIKPCVSAFGGDQIEFSMPDGQTKERVRRIFFSAFFFATNVGAFLSMIFTPLLRANLSYAVAFGIPALLMGLSIIIFWSGRGAYVDRRAVGSFYPSFIKIIISAVRLRKKESGYVNYEQVNCRGGSSSHWLDAAKLSCGAQEVDNVKAIIRVIVFLLPAPLFWCLYGQKASTWVFQAKQMNGHVSWLGNIVIRPDQMQALDPLLVLVFVPLFDQVMYPFLEKHGVAMKATKRLILGMLLASVAFFTSGLLQLAIDKRITTGSITSYNNTFSDSKPKNKYHMGLFDIAYTNEKEKQISILWQVPQYVILTAAEVIFMVTGLEFSYSQASFSEVSCSSNLISDIC